MKRWSSDLPSCLSAKKCFRVKDRARRAGAEEGAMPNTGVADRKQMIMLAFLIDERSCRTSKQFK